MRVEGRGDFPVPGGKSGWDCGMSHPHATAPRDGEAPWSPAGLNSASVFPSALPNRNNLPWVCSCWTRGSGSSATPETPKHQQGMGKSCLGLLRWAQTSHPIPSLSPGKDSLQVWAEATNEGKIQPSQIKCWHLFQLIPSEPEVPPCTENSLWETRESQILPLVNPSQCPPPALVSISQ